MSRKRARLSRKILLTDLCSQPGEDDGIDPRSTARPPSDRQVKVDRKTLQLCGQVARVVESVLTGEIRDDDLAGLYVLSVTPNTHRGHLVVSVSPGAASSAASAEVILSKLQAQTRRIRSEVSAAITRRKTPELVFLFVPEPHLDPPSDPPTEDAHHA